MLCSPDSGDINAIEKHSELRCIELHLPLAQDRLSLEFSALQTFVPKDKAALVEAEDLHAIATLGNEDIEMTTVDVFTGGEHKSAETMKAFAHVGGFGKKHDLHRRR